jgi:outer membrane protein assembly factor BamD (BamD/ComL family)
MSKHLRTTATFSGIAIYLIGVILIGSQLRHVQPFDFEHFRPYAQNCLVFLMFSLGLGTTLLALGGLLRHQQAKRDIVQSPAAVGVLGQSPPAQDIARPLQLLQAQIDELGVRLRMMFSLIEERLKEQPLSINAPAEHAIDPEKIDRITEVLHEIRELSLLSDEARRELLSSTLNDRKMQGARDVLELAAKQEWKEALRLLLSLESQFPTDNQVIISRREFDRMHSSAEAESVTTTRDRVDQMLAAGEYDEAVIAATKLVENFPENVQAQALHARAARDREVAGDMGAQRMLDEVRHEVENHSWREALVKANFMLEKYPDNPRTDRLRRQLAAIQENAEIEERQAIEVQIHELIRNRQLREAISLGEGLLRKYPSSPQADSLESMLPRLKQLLAEDESAEAPADSIA